MKTAPVLLVIVIGAFFCKEVISCALHDDEDGHHEHEHHHDHDEQPAAKGQLGHNHDHEPATKSQLAHDHDHGHKNNQDDSDGAHSHSSDSGPNYEEEEDPMRHTIDTDNDNLTKRRRQAKNEPYLSNSLEEILARIKARRGQIPSKLQTTGAFKYLTASQPERKALTIETGTQDEIEQYNSDFAEIESIIYSNYGIYTLYSELSEFIYDSLFSDAIDSGENIDNEIYWTKEKKTKVIKALDEAFKNIPAWGRYWRFTFEKKLAFMEKYG